MKDEKKEAVKPKHDKVFYMAIDCVFCFGTLKATSGKKYTYPSSWIVG